MKGILKVEYLDKEKPVINEIIVVKYKSKISFEQPKDIKYRIGTNA